MTTSERLRDAEKRVARARTVLDKTQRGLHAAESVAIKTEKAGRPVLMALGILAIAGAVWLIVKRRRE